MRIAYIPFQDYVLSVLLFVSVAQETLVVVSINHNEQEIDSLQQLTVIIEWNRVQAANLIAHFSPAACMYTVMESG